MSNLYVCLELLISHIFLDRNLKDNGTHVREKCAAMGEREKEAYFPHYTVFTKLIWFAC